MEILRTDYVSWIPRICYTYRGYRGLDKGIHLEWRGYFVHIIKPINERE